MSREYEQLAAPVVLRRLSGSVSPSCAEYSQRRGLACVLCVQIEKYTYEVCPFDRAEQKEGRHHGTSLGRWQGFLNNYTSMSFTEGDHCWQGPRRSLHVSRPGMRGRDPSRRQCNHSAWLANNMATFAMAILKTPIGCLNVLTREWSGKESVSVSRCWPARLPVA